MKSIVSTIRTFAALGGWAPCLVFALHLVLAGVFDVYHRWPPVDIPMHLFGGIAIALFFSRSIRALLTGLDQRILVPLELVLILSLTASAAVCWEFLEFAFDWITGSRVQPGLANTMQDMALGILGACVVAGIRLRRAMQRRSIWRPARVWPEPLPRIQYPDPDRLDR